MKKPEKRKRGLPKKVFIYVCDYDDDGELYYAVSTTLDGIPEDEDGERIGSYSLEETGILKVERFITNMK